MKILVLITTLLLSFGSPAKDIIKTKELKIVLEACAQTHEDMKYWKHKYESMSHTYTRLRNQLNEQSSPKVITVKPARLEYREVGYFYYDDDGNYIYQEISNTRTR